MITYTWKTWGATLRLVVELEDEARVRLISGAGRRHPLEESFKWFQGTNHVWNWIKWNWVVLLHSNTFRANSINQHLKWHTITQFCKNKSKINLIFFKTNEPASVPSYMICLNLHSFLNFQDKAKMWNYSKLYSVDANHMDTLFQVDYRNN